MILDNVHRAVYRSVLYMMKGVMIYLNQNVEELFLILVI